MLPVWPTIDLSIVANRALHATDQAEVSIPTVLPSVEFTGNEQQVCLFLPERATQNVSNGHGINTIINAEPQALKSFMRGAYAVHWGVAECDPPPCS